MVYFLKKNRPINPCVKSLPLFRTKGEGTCKQGERSDLTGCTPASGETSDRKPANNNQSATDWVNDYVYDAVKVNLKEGIGLPSKENIQDLAQYVPKKPITLYRWVSGEGSGSTGQQLRSWTHNKEFADALLEGHDEQGKVIKKVFYPDEILVDTTMLPKEVQDELPNQAEVVVAYGKLLKEMRKVRGTEQKSPEAIREKYNGK